MNTLAELCAAIEAKRDIKGSRLRSILSDSRRIEKGDIFVAMKGPSTDGNLFAQAALDKGALLVVCENPVPAELAEQAIGVDDIKSAYRHLATAWRRRFAIPVVLVAGSVGKTTTKELTKTALESGGWETLATRGSQNGFDGVPFTLLEMREKHRAAIIEVGIDEVGAMEKHAATIEATHAIVTQVSEEHLDGLHDLETITQEECACLRWVDAHGGIAFVNHQDARIRDFAGDTLRRNTVDFAVATESTGTPPVSMGKGFFGILDEKRGDLHVQQIGTFDAQHRDFDPQHRDFEPQHRAEVTYPIFAPAKHIAQAVLSAHAIASCLGARPQPTAFQESPKELWGRNQRKCSPGGTTFLCDYYNASPASMRAAFQLARTEADRNATQGRLFFLLADMLELGPEEQMHHEALATSMLQAKPDGVWLLGTRMRHLACALGAQADAPEVFHSLDLKTLLRSLEPLLQSGDTVLLKGSRSMHLEKAEEQLLASDKPR